MRHFVLTRFNVRLDEQSAPPDEAWIRKRIPLFERFTEASMHGQSVHPDHWIIFVDMDSPDWLVTRLTRVAEVVPVTGAFTAALAQSAVGNADARLVTTRLDCDDAIACDYLARVQREAFELEGGFINFPHGFQLAGDRLYRRSDPSNAFITLVEQAPFKTVFMEPHDRIVGRHAVRQVNAPPSWLQVIHGDNLGNTVHGVRTSGKHLARFRLDVSVTDEALFLDRVRTSVGLAARVARRPHRIVWAWRLLVSAHRTRRGRA